MTPSQYAIAVAKQANDFQRLLLAHTLDDMESYRYEALEAVRLKYRDILSEVLYANGYNHFSDGYKRAMDAFEKKIQTSFTGGSGVAPDIQLDDE